LGKPPNDKILHCVRCKRPILEHEYNDKSGLAYCFGCDYYFPLAYTLSHKREEIIVPNGTNTFYISQRKNKLEIKLKWFRNFKLTSLLKQCQDEVSFVLASMVYLFNYTHIVVSKDSIRIDNKPFDHILPMTFYSSHIVEQLYVKLKPSKWGLIDSYCLYGRIKGVGEVALLWDLKETTLLFFEQEIERVLGIEDEDI